MVLTSILIVVAVGLLAFAVISKPFHEGLDDKGLQELPDKDLIVLNSKCKNWLHDLEVEYSTGKLDEQGYLHQKSVLENQIEQIETRLNDAEIENKQALEKDVENLISGRRMERVERSAGFCVNCGAPLQQSDVFCSKCGTKMK